MLPNGSAFVRVDPPEQSPDDLYISAAQVRRCELVSGDRVSGPVRAPRRSERYASLLRIDTINGASADEVAAGTRYEDVPADWPAERLALAAGDPTLEAIEWLTPLGRGSRAVIAGGRFAGKSEVLRRIAGALQEQVELTLSVALGGCSPGGGHAVERRSARARGRAQLRRLGRRPGAGAGACARDRPSHGRPRRPRGRPDRHPRRTPPARRPQGPVRGPQPARQWLADGDRNHVQPLGRGDDRGRARPPSRLHRPSATRSTWPPAGRYGRTCLVGEDGAAAITRARASALED